MRIDNDSSLSDEVSQMMFHIGIVSDHFNDSNEQPKEIAVSAVVESLDVLLDLREFEEVDYGFGGFEDLLFDAGSVHIENAR